MDCHEAKASRNDETHKTIAILCPLTVFARRLFAEAIHRIVNVLENAKSLKFTQIFLRNPQKILAILIFSLWIATPIFTMNRRLLALKRLHANNANKIISVL